MPLLAPYFNIFELGSVLSVMVANCRMENALYLFNLQNAAACKLQVLIKCCLVLFLHPCIYMFL